MEEVNIYVYNIFKDSCSAPTSKSYCISDRTNWERNSDYSCGASEGLEGTVDSMSYMVGIVNKNGVVLAADSRVWRGNKGYFDGFKKVFRSDEHQRIWSVVGNYGEKEELLYLICDYLKNTENIDEEELRKIYEKYYKRSLPKGITNILVGEIKDVPVLSVYDYVSGKLTARTNNELDVIYAGSNKNMHDYILTLEEVRNMSLKKMEKTAEEIIEKEIKIEKFIKKMNPNYIQWIGGEVRIELLRNE